MASADRSNDRHQDRHFMTASQSSKIVSSRSLISTGISGARTANGNVAAPPKSPNNSRRRMVDPTIRMWQGNCPDSTTGRRPWTCPPKYVWGTPTSEMGVRRDKAALSSGCKSHPATAPAGSNRSSYGGNEIAEAFGMRVTNWPDRRLHPTNATASI